MSVCCCSVFCKDWWRLCTWNCSSDSKYLLFLYLEYCQLPECIEAISLNITPCFISILIFLIHIFIMMSFSFSRIPFKNRGDSLVQDVMLSCSNCTILLLFYMLLCSSYGCMLVSWCEISSSLLGDFMIFVMMKQNWKFCLSFLAPPPMCMSLSNRQHIFTGVYFTSLVSDLALCWSHIKEVDLNKRQHVSHAWPWYPSWYSDLL
jgi:hypothetical protein